MRRALLVASALVVAACSSSPTDVPAPQLSPDSLPLPPVAASLGTGAAPRLDASLERLRDSQAAAPVELAIPALDLAMPISSVGIAGDGTMEVPDDATVAGWYRFGATPGAGTGSAVIAAHVDDATTGLGPFSRLKTLTEGAAVTVTDGDGRTHEFTVVAVEQRSKATVVAEELFAREGEPRLALVTCGGAWNATLRHYTDNVIVWAVPRGESS